MIQFTSNKCICSMKNVTHHKKCEKTKSKNCLNQGELHKCVRNVDIYLENLF